MTLLLYQRLNDMAEIKINGKTYPIHFGLRAINEHAKNTKFSFEQMTTSNDALSALDDIVGLIHTGLNEGARKAGSDQRFTITEVWDLCEEDPRAILVAADVFQQSINVCMEKLGESVGKN